MSNGWWRYAVTAQQGGNWSTVGNWYSSLSGTGAIATVPGTGETATFTSTTLATGADLLIALNAAGGRSVGSVVLNGRRSVTIAGGSWASNVYTAANQPFTLESGATVPSGYNLYFSNLSTFTISQSQIWTVDGTIWLYDTVTLANNPGVIITKAGGWAVVSYANSPSFTASWAHTAGRLVAANPNAFGTGAITMSAGTYLAASSGQTFPNPVTINGSVGLGDWTNNAQWGGDLTLSGTVTIGATATLTADVDNTVGYDVTFSGQFNGSSPVTFAKAAARSAQAFRLTGTSLGTFNNTVSIGAGVTLRLAEYTTGTPNQLNNASSVTVASGGFLSLYGNTGTTIPYAIVSSGTGSVYVYTPATITFQGNLASLNGPLNMQVSSSFLTNTTQRIVFNNAAQVGTASYYALYSDAGYTYTNLTQIIEYTGAAAATNAKIIFIDHVSNNGGTFIYRNNSSNGSTLNQTQPIRHNRNTIAETLTIDAVGGPMVFSSTGTLTEAATGVLTVTKTGTYAVTLSGANNFRGAFTLSQGPLTANNATALGAAASTTDVSVASTTTLTFAVAASYTSRTLKVLGGTVVVGHAGTTTTFLAITANTAASSFRGTSSGSLAATNGIACGTFRPTFSAASGSSITVTAAITGSGGLLVGIAGDTGKVTLAAANAGLSGTTTLAYGTLQVANAAALGSTGVAQAAGTVLQTPSSDGKLTITGASYTNTGTGTVTIRIGGST